MTGVELLEDYILIGLKNLAGGLEEEDLAIGVGCQGIDDFR